jgi:hypothetical protein
MRALLIAGILGGIMVAVTLADDNKAEINKDDIEQIVEPVEGAFKLNVTGRSTLLRIPVSTIAGGQISDPAITGPAKLVRTADIRRVSEDGPMIGNTNKEFVFASTGAGEVKIVIKITTPTGGDAERIYVVTWK